MAGLSLALLGSFRAEYDGYPLNSFRSSKVQALLVYLLVEDAFAGEAIMHRREALMGLLWPERDKRAAQSNLRQTLYYLRQALAQATGEGGKPFLLSDRHTVWVNQSARYDLDVAAFLDDTWKVAEHEHEEKTLCRECRRRLKRAAALYTGDFLEDFRMPESAPFEEWVLVKREILRRQALEGMEGLATAYLSGGEYVPAEALARRQLEIDPLQEPAHRQLMEALARGGRRAAALRQFKACARILETALDVEPAASTRKLYEAIVRGDLAPQAREDGRNGEGTPETGAGSDGRRRHLPNQPSPFIGRRRELVEVCERLRKADCRLLTIVGLGGIGKTRLALAVAEEVAGEFIDVFYVSLGPLSSVEDLASTIGDVVEAPSGRRSAQDVVLDYLEGKEALLLLDSYEHLLPDVSLVNLILQRCPDVTLLVTSRARLQLRREWLYDLSGLQVQVEHDEAIGDAVELFLYHARRVRANIRLGDGAVNTIMEICQAVDGVPLAIELAAAAVRYEELEEIAEYVNRDMVGLSSKVRDVAERHQSIEAAFDHSWNLLGQEERDVLARLSVFRGGFTLEAAKVVTNGTKQLLRVLVENSLVRRSEKDRYDMHELLRQYGARKLAEMGNEFDEITDRHMRYYGEMLASVQPGTLATRKWIRENLDNIRRAWDIGVRRSAISLLSQMVGPLAIFYYGSRRLHEEATRRFSAAVVAVRKREDTSQPEVQNILGRLIAWLAYFTDDDEKAFRLADQAVQLLRPSCTKSNLALALSLRGYAAYAIRDVEGATKNLLESRAIYEELGDLLGITGPLNALAEVYSFVGEYESAVRYGERCRAISDQIGLDKMSSMVRTHLSNAMCARGEYDRAEALATEALALAEEIGSAEHKIISLFRLAENAFAAGRYEEAERRLSTILSFPDLAVEQPDYHVRALTLYGELCRVEGRAGEANDYVVRALETAKETTAVDALPSVLIAAANLLEDDMPARAAEVVTLLQVNRRSNAEVKGEARALLGRLEEQSPAAFFDEAQERGQDVDLWAVARSLRQMFMTGASP